MGHSSIVQLFACIDPFVIFTFSSSPLILPHVKQHSVVKGDLLTVLNSDDKHWIWVTLKGSPAAGFVPKSIVKDMVCLNFLNVALLVFLALSVVSFFVHSTTVTHALSLIL